MRYTNKKLTVVLLSMVMTLVLAMAVQAQGDGIMEGQVVNGTPGAPEVGAGVPVALHLFQENAPTEFKETTTDAQGRFRFEGLATDANLDYWLEVLYQDTAYASVEPYQFDGEETTLTATITVYEPTSDADNISLGSVHLIAESFGGEMLRITEIHLLNNSGETAYVGSTAEGGQKAVAFIPLPENAVGFAFQEGTSSERFVEVEGGWLDTAPVPPGDGTSTIFFSYHLGVGGETVPLERRFAYPVSGLNVLVAQPGLTLQSDQLQDLGQQSIQDSEYEFYASEDLLPAGSPLQMEFIPVAGTAAAPVMPSGSEGSTLGGAEGSAPGGTEATPRGNQELILWIGLSLAVLAIGAVIIYALSTTRPASDPESGPDLASDPETSKTLAKLADLEDALEAGDVDEATYERQRAELYDTLKSA